MPSLTDINNFFKGAADPAMWRSLGWIVLGIVLLALGVTGWVKSTSLGQAAIGVASRGVL